MAHCPYNKLTDLEPIFESLRGWAGVREKSPGIFYFKSTPFLHFHEKDGARWADVRNGKGWTEIDIAVGAGKAMRMDFQRQVQEHYEKLLRRGSL